MIVDMHTHWGAAWADQDQTDPSQGLKIFDSYGITHAILMASLALSDNAEIARDNDRVAEVCRRSGGRMIPCLTVHPCHGVRAVEEARRCIKTLGARGMKFHPWLQGFSVMDKTMDELAELAAEHNLPVFFHDGTPCYSMPSQIAGLARRHPRTIFVLGHAGLLELWREGIEAVRRHTNLWACMCGPHLAAQKEYFRCCDHQRLVWGSDYGFGFADPISYRLGLLQALKLPDHVMECVLDKNPRRLLRLAGA